MDMIALIDRYFRNEIELTASPTQLIDRSDTSTNHVRFMSNPTVMYLSFRSFFNVTYIEIDQSNG